MGRLDVSKRELARRLHVTDMWVGRRLMPTSTVPITLEETVAMAEALGVTAESLLAAVLPRLDSNQQPSGYLFAEVNAHTGRLWWPGAANDETLADVVDIATRRAS